MQRADYPDMRTRVVLDGNERLGADPNFPVREVFLRKVREAASECEPGDWFIFFYAGHGGNIADKSGDEKTGMDQAFLLPNDRAKIRMKDAVIDDEFAVTLDSCVPLGVRILVLCDACHSGTICDIDSFKYRHEIYQISATQDSEEASDTGHGGAFTICMRQATKELSMKYGDEEYSIEEMFELCDELCSSKTDTQHLSFQWSGTDPSLVAWPLSYPWWRYLSSPLPNWNSDSRVQVTGAPSPWYFPRALDREESDS
jgi:hypothetical protein